MGTFRGKRGNFLGWKRWFLVTKVRNRPVTRSSRQVQDDEEANMAASSNVNFAG